MFKLIPNEINDKIFYVKSNYKTDEPLDYTLKIFNHISKSGFELEMTDVSPWVSGITNSSELTLEDEVIFNADYSYNITSFEDGTHTYNNYIKIDGIEHIYVPTSNINFVSSTKYNDEYAIIFNNMDSGQGELAVMNNLGQVVNDIVFCENPVSNTNIIKCGDMLIIGYHDQTLNISYLNEIHFDGGNTTMSTPTMLINGEAIQLKINKRSDCELIVTYNTLSQGIIRIVKVSPDHIFSVGTPFVYNDDVTLFSSSVYQNDNVVILFYDVDEQLKVKNCKIYDDYIGIGLPSIILNNYAYQLNIDVLDDEYVYVTYYDAGTIKVYTQLLKIEDDDVTIIDNATPIEDWVTGMYMTTISDSRFMLSYMNSNYVGVSRYIDIEKTNTINIDVDYNQFLINMNEVNVKKNKGHNDYWIYYQNEIVEQGIMKIQMS